ncbi:MAG: DUF4190 domain-containing protein [Microbacterium sp.]
MTDPTPPSGPSPDAAAPTYQPPAYPAPAPYTVPQAVSPAPQQRAYGSYPGAPYGYAYPAAARSNALAVIALISGIAGLTLLPFIGSIAAAVTGHISLAQIARTGEPGRGMALTGVILGWVGVVGAALLTIFVVWIFYVIGTAASTMQY